MLSLKELDAAHIVMFLLKDDNILGRKKEGFRKIVFFKTIVQPFCHGDYTIQAICQNLSHVHKTLTQKLRRLPDLQTFFFIYFHICIVYENTFLRETK